MPAKKLLVADDSLTIQKVIRLALSNEGYEIQAISDGAEAIQQICTFRPDAVLIDVSLPTRSAFEIKREVNEMPDYAATRFVLMSSAFEKIDEAQSEEVGFDGHLTKPFDPAHLRQILSEVLAAPPAPHAPPAHTMAPPPPAPLPPAPPPSLPAAATDASSKIQLDFPSNLPPSDFEVTEPTHGKLLSSRRAAAEEMPPPLPPALELDLPQSAGETEAPEVEHGFQLGSELGSDPGSDPSDDDELWGKHEDTPPPRPFGDRPEKVRPEKVRDEIRELTESTIRMSGLADIPAPESDFDWTVDEPSIRPPSSLSDTGESSFRIAPPTFSENDHSPPDMLPNGMPEIPDISKMGMSSALPAGFEDAIRKQVQQTLEKMAREILPEVAERVIKAEISRLLNEKS